MSETETGNVAITLSQEFVSENVDKTDHFCKGARGERVDDRMFGENVDGACREHT